jgi:catechol 1,2-dioxygenase
MPANGYSSSIYEETASITINQGEGSHSNNLVKKEVITALAARAAGLDNKNRNLRLKQVVNRLLVDLMTAIDERDTSMDKFRPGVAFIGQAGTANELGMIVPGVAIEHFLD